ncbi:dihydrofolate reductase [Fructilactobacillus lindneri]|uniref:dihydrofolate reductase n=2 Tax=Fructilactobacillus lindneri TaxID=53444 RepID=A0A0R2JPF6_9LACO|nr:dihydrofolate reductase [Fructilactobacillus lindneri]ANZ58163.1 dihydrofolate reductase [Fructilactobacillus lindneri]ANZ59484.1 dihydrofolate reductase [Fructilactobacillus lindneri]KRN78984.1 dihydrofolate reductase [Fructilactobacillus lindneri DSM 20690 = JCM 11027]POG98732.1 dihydrofolate reductase [Fructilactobacillus lindneri]POH03005.1 dihydrofolate reductase [Fructilactobacillus lindneri]
MLAYIWAEAKNHVIGKNGNLPWNIPDDMKFFKEQTLNHQILAGYTTYKSFGRPLPHRKNLVLTHRNPKQFPVDVKVFSDENDFLQYANKYKDDIIFVVGGRKVYEALLPYVKLLYRTSIDKEVDGDTKMIPIDYSKFEKIKEIPGKDNSEYPHQFDIFKRKVN